MSKILGNYDGLMDFIKRNYQQNPGYSIGQLCYVQESYRQWIILWYAWYSGYVEAFHKYTVYNGSESVEKIRKTLKMAKKVCEDKSSLLLNEKVNITVSDDDAKKLIDGVLKTNLFRSRSNELIEKTQALGTGAYVEFLERDKIVIDYLTADKVIPISIVNGKIINAAFASVSTVGNQKLVYLNVHIRIYPVDETFTEEEIEARRDLGIADDYNGYIIENKNLKFSQDGKYETSIDTTDEILDLELTNSVIPRFQIIKPAIANNICLDDLGLGLSVFSNALDQLIGGDLVYDSYLNEFDLGKKRIFIHDDLAQIDIESEGGETVMKPMFDTNDTTFYAVDMGEDSDKIKEIDFTLRIEEHELGLNRMLNLIGFKCGMGNNYYKFEGGVVKTATEVISENNPLYRSIKKDQHVLNEAIVGMSAAILDISNQYLKTSYKTDQDITVEFDDSIFEDTDKIRKDALVELGSGAIDQIEYHMRVYKLTEELATEKVNKMRARTPQEINVDDMGGGA